jgi:hypothetical protein
MVGNLNMNGYQIDNLATPTASGDAATKDYVDAFTGNTGIPGHTRWRKLASAGQTVFSGTGDYGGVLSYSPVREQVYLNGALQQRNADYSADNGTSVTFNVALHLNDVVDIVCTNNLVSGTVSNAANISYSGQFTGQTTRTVAAKLADVVSVKDFGAVGDGVTDDTAAIQAAFNAANLANARLIFPTAVYKISGSTIFTVQTSVDFQGSTILATTWTGRFRILRKKAKQTYGAGSNVLNELNATSAGYLVKGSTAFNGWLNTEEVVNSYVRITYNTDFYSYRLNTVKRTEINKVYRDGILSSPIKYALTGATATQVEVWPMEDGFTDFQNLILDYSQASNVGNSSPIRIETSLLNVSNISFKLPTAINTSNNPILVYVTESCAVTLDNIYTPFSQIVDKGSGSEFTYSLSLEDSYDIIVSNFKSDGNGWGATGSNTCQRVTFTNCDLSRIDFHNPVREYLKVDNCNIGSWGITACTLGDLLVTNSQFIRRNGPAYQVAHTAYIQSRVDTGGFCDGDLVVSNCTFRATSAGGNLLATVPTTGNPKPAGSPIDYTFYKNVTVENCSFEDTGGFILNPLITQTGVVGEEIEYPAQFSVNSCTGVLYYIPNLDGQTPSFSITPGSKPYAADSFNHVFKCSDSTFVRIHLLEEASGKFYVRAILDRVTPYYATSLTASGLKSLWLRMTVNGIMSTNNCSITKIDVSHTNPGTATINPCSVNIANSTIIDNFGVDSGSQIIKKDSSATVDIVLSNCIISGTNADRINVVFNALVDCCDLYLNGSIYTPVLTNDIGTSSGTFTFITPTSGYQIVPRSGQKYTLLSGFGGSNNTTADTFTYPSLTNFSAFPSGIDNTTGNEQPVRIRRSGASTAAVTSSSATVRYITYYRD